MLLSRVLSALVLIPLVLAVLYMGDWPLLLVALAAAAIGWSEFHAMFWQGGQPLFRWLGLALTLLLVASAHQGARLEVVGVTAALLLSSALWVMLPARPPQEAVIAWSLTLLGVLYVGWLLRYALLLRGLPQGWEWSLTALAGTWAADTGAYLVGRAAGRRKFCPRISPGKTWEGVFGGLALTVIVTMLAGAIVLNLDPLLAILLGVVVTAAAVAGDLTESLIKRAAGVKDSGVLIPGHGGLLDRADSLLFVWPVVYYFAVSLAS